MLSTYQLEQYIIEGFGPKIGATLPQLTRYIRSQQQEYGLEVSSREEIFIAVRIALATGEVKRIGELGLGNENKYNNSYYVLTQVDPIPYVQLFFEQESWSLRGLTRAYIRKMQLPYNYDVADEVKEEIIALVTHRYLDIDRNSVLTLGPRYIELVDLLLEE